LHRDKFRVEFPFRNIENRKTSFSKGTIGNSNSNELEYSKVQYLEIQMNSNEINYFEMMKKSSEVQKST